jgi:hypothetical protein
VNLQFVGASHLLMSMCNACRKHALVHCSLLRWWGSSSQVLVTAPADRAADLCCAELCCAELCCAQVAQVLPGRQPASQAGDGHCDAVLCVDAHHQLPLLVSGRTTRTRPSRSGHAGGVMAWASLLTGKGDDQRLIPSFRLLQSCFARPFMKPGIWMQWTAMWAAHARLK